MHHYKQNAAITNTVSVCSVSLSQSVHHVQALVSQYRSNKCLYYQVQCTYLKQIVPTFAVGAVQVYFLGRSSGWDSHVEKISICVQHKYLVDNNRPLCSPIYSCSWSFICYITGIPLNNNYLVLCYQLAFACDVAVIKLQIDSMVKW